MDYRPEIYTQIGFDWVEKTTMVDVIKRHFPLLKKRLDDYDIANAFVPWVKNQRYHFLVSPPKRQKSRFFSLFKKKEIIMMMKRFKLLGVLFFLMMGSWSSMAQSWWNDSEKEKVIGNLPKGLSK